MHVAEEVLDEDFPIADFFDEVDSEVLDAGQTILATVRRRRPVFMRYLALSRLERDFVRHDIVRCTSVKGIPVHLVDATSCVNWMIEQARIGYTIYPWAKKKKILTP